MNRQKTLLLVLLVILALAVAYALLSGPKQQRVVRSPGLSEDVQQQAATPAERPRVYLSQLEPQAGEFPGARRDLFAPLYAAPERPPAPPAPPPVTPPPPPRPEPRETTPAPTPSPRAAEPPVRFSYLGFLEMEGRRVVFLESGDKVHLAREGETFGDGFRVLELTESQVVIARGDEGRPQVSPLAEDNARTGGGRGEFSVPGQQSRRPASLPAGRF